MEEVKFLCANELNGAPERVNWKVEVRLILVASGYRYEVSWAGKRGPGLEEEDGEGRDRDVCLKCFSRARHDTSSTQLTSVS